MAIATEEKPLTRCGYNPNESLKSFEAALVESGAVAIGKSMHFAADVVCSGGYEAWAKTVWDYVISHVGIASPRVFVYLLKRLREIDELFKKYPNEELYNNTEFHTRIGEIVMVLREVPRRPKIVWPKVGPETHRDGWVRSVSAAPETAILQKVWKREGDLMVLRFAGNEICAAIRDGSTEKVLFWVKWMFDEEAYMKKDNRSATLTTIHRGTGGGSELGNFIVELFLEAYRDLARQNLLRMNEEFLALGRIWKGEDSRITTGARKHVLGLMAQILCEVPRWKIPAAPSLIKDPIQVSRAVTQSAKFFHEVLANPPVPYNKALEKMFKMKNAGPGGGKAKPKDEKQLTMDDKIEAYDRAVEAFMNR